jgi:DNA modification methylase
MPLLFAHAQNRHEKAGRREVSGLDLPINQIVAGNCIDVMKTFPADSIDLVMTSPPYSR